MRSSFWQTCAVLLAVQLIAAQDSNQCTTSQSGQNQLREAGPVPTDEQTLDSWTTWGYFCCNQKFPLDDFSVRTKDDTSVSCNGPNIQSLLSFQVSPIAITESACNTPFIPCALQVRGDLKAYLDRGRNCTYAPALEAHCGESGAPESIYTQPLPFIDQNTPPKWSRTSVDIIISEFTVADALIEDLQFAYATDWSDQVGSKNAEFLLSLESDQDDPIIRLDDVHTYLVEGKQAKQPFVRLQRRIPYKTCQSHGCVFQMNLTATDDGEPPLSSKLPVKITVVDENDQKPEFESTASLVMFDEDSVDRTVTTVKATDGDTGINCEISYSLVNPPAGFSIEPGTGTITANSDVVWRQSGSNLYQLTIKAAEVPRNPVDDKCSSDMFSLQNMVVEVTSKSQGVFDLTTPNQLSVLRFSDTEEVAGELNITQDGLPFAESDYSVELSNAMFRLENGVLTKKAGAVVQNQSEEITVTIKDKRQRVLLVRTVVLIGRDPERPTFGNPFYMVDHFYGDADPVFSFSNELRCLDCQCQISSVRPEEPVQLSLEGQEINVLNEESVNEAAAQGVFQSSYVLRCQSVSSQYTTSAALTVNWHTGPKIQTASVISVPADADFESCKLVIGFVSTMGGFPYPLTYSLLDEGQIQPFKINQDGGIVLCGKLQFNEYWFDVRVSEAQAPQLAVAIGVVVKVIPVVPPTAAPTTEPTSIDTTTVDEFSSTTEPTVQTTDAASSPVVPDDQTTQASDITSSTNPTDATVTSTQAPDTTGSTVAPDASSTTSAPDMTTTATVVPNTSTSLPDATQTTEASEPTTAGVSDGSSTPAGTDAPDTSPAASVSDTTIAPPQRTTTNDVVTSTTPADVTETTTTTEPTLPDVQTSSLPPPPPTSPRPTITTSTRTTTRTSTLSPAPSPTTEPTIVPTASTSNPSVPAQLLEGLQSNFSEAAQRFFNFESGQLQIKGIPPSDSSYRLDFLEAVAQRSERSVEGLGTQHYTIDIKVLPRSPLGISEILLIVLGCVLLISLMFLVWGARKVKKLRKDLKLFIATPLPKLTYGSTAVANRTDGSSTGNANIAYTITEAVHGESDANGPRVGQGNLYNHDPQHGGSTNAVHSIRITGTVRGESDTNGVRVGQRNLYDIEAQHTRSTTHLIEHDGMSETSDDASRFFDPRVDTRRYSDNISVFSSVSNEPKEEVIYAAPVVSNPTQHEPENEDLVVHEDREELVLIDEPEPDYETNTPPPPPPLMTFVPIPRTPEQTSRTTPLPTTTDQIPIIQTPISSVSSIRGFETQNSPRSGGDRFLSELKSAVEKPILRPVEGGRTVSRSYSPFIQEQMGFDHTRQLPQSAVVPPPLPAAPQTEVPKSTFRSAGLETIVEVNGGTGTRSNSNSVFEDEDRTPL